MKSLVVFVERARDAILSILCSSYEIILITN